MLIELAQVAEREKLAVGEDEHVIGEPPELIGVVGDPHDGDAAVGDLATEVFDRSPGLTVERGGRLVGEQDLRAREEGARDRHALRLAAAEPIGLAVEEVGGQCDVLEHVARPFVGHLGVGDAEIVEDGASEHRCLLEHHAHMTSECGRVPGAEVSTLQGDRSGDRIVEPVEEAEEGRLARARRSGDGEDPVDRDRHVDVAQDRSIGRTGAHTVEFERRRVRVAPLGRRDRIGGHERKVVVARRQTVDVRRTDSHQASGPPGGRVDGRSRWWMALVALAVSVAAPWAASTVFAHSGLVAASPGPGETVGGDVSTIQLFYGDIIVTFDATITRQADGEVLDADAEMTSEITGELRLAEPLSEPGEYAVRHSVLSIDDDVVEAAYLFSYEPEAPEPILVFLPEEDEGGLAWWAWTIIGVGAVVIIVLAVRLIVSIRRARTDPA